VRSITAAFRSELTASQCDPRFLVEIETTASFLRYWTGSADVLFSGDTFQGNGFLKRVDNVSESDDGTDGIEVHLSGEPSVIVSVILQSLEQNSVGKLWLAFLNDSGVIITSPLLMFSGELDTVELIDGPTEATAILTYESLSSKLEGSKNLRLNHETQITLFAGDLGLEYVPQLEDWQGYWGRPNQNNKGKKKKKRTAEDKEARKKLKQELKVKRKRRKKRRGRRKR